MVVGNGRMFRARTEHDAETFRRELAEGPRRRPLTRGKLLFVTVAFVLVLAAWGLVELFG